MTSRAIPWYLWCALLASGSVALGVHWDIAWHRSIGRDTFWSPPHMMIYAAAILAALASGSQILRATFTRGEAPGTVRVLGFRGPLGAFITAWGGITMLTSAPFDDWWHNAYGLDVKILSPPHVLLAIGVGAIHVGVLIFVLGRMNRVEGRARQLLTVAFLFVSAMLLLALMTLFMERTVRARSCTARRSTASSRRSRRSSCARPRAGRATAGARRWRPRSTPLFLLALLWLMPLVPAQPKLGPVMVQVRSLVPPEFPLLLIVPAIALDLLAARAAGRWSRARLAVAGGALFAASFFVVQWPFATFLMSPGARNAFFGAIYFDYNMPPQMLYRHHQFIPHATGPGALLTGACISIAIAIAGSWLGLRWGNWMRRIRR